MGGRHGEGTKSEHRLGDLVPETPYIVHCDEMSYVYLRCVSDDLAAGIETSQLARMPNGAAVMDSLSAYISGSGKPSYDTSPGV